MRQDVNGFNGSSGGVEGKIRGEESFKLSAEDIYPGLSERESLRPTKPEES